MFGASNNTRDLAKHKDSVESDDLLLLRLDLELARGIAKATQLLAKRSFVVIIELVAVEYVHHFERVLSRELHKCWEVQQVTIDLLIIQLIGKGGADLLKLHAFVEHDITKCSGHLRHRGTLEEALLSGRPDSRGVLIGISKIRREWKEDKRK